MRPSCRYEQFQNILKMGPLNKVMEAIPGFSQMLKQTGGSGKDFDSGQKIRSYITMMDSMTDAELDDNRVGRSPCFSLSVHVLCLVLSVSSSHMTPHSLTLCCSGAARQEDSR
jgi:hypothetical protein